MKKILKIVIAICLIIMIVILGLSTYIGIQMTNRSDKVMEVNPDLGFEEITLVNSDEDIYALQIDNDSDTTMIVLHGYKDDLNQDGRLDQIVNHYSPQYNIVTFDFRAHGKSSGDYITFGYNERKDVLSAIETIKEQDPEQNIIVYGFSMGAATALQTVMEDDSNIDAVIADSPYADFNTFLDDNFTIWTGLPNVPFKPITVFTSELIRGFSVEELDVYNNLETEVPIYLVHSNDDESILSTNSIKIYDHIESYNVNNTLVLVDGYEHCKYLNENPDEYFTNLDEFLNRVNIN